MRGVKHIHLEENLEHNQYEVYILVCPITKKVKYIGCSSKATHRYVQHLSELSYDNDFINWRNGLKNIDKKPILKIIASFKTKILAFAYEAFLIREYGKGIYCRDNYRMVNVRKHLNNLEH